MKSIYFNDFEDFAKQQIQSQYQCSVVQNVQHNNSALCVTFTFNSRTGEFTEEYTRSIMYEQSMRCKRNDKAVVLKDEQVSVITMNIINALDNIDSHDFDNSNY